MALPAQDDFSGHGDGDLTDSADWTDTIGAWSPVVDTEEVTGNAGGDACARWVSDTPNDAQYCQIKAVNNEYDYGPTCRTIDTNFYLFDNNAGGDLTLYHYNGAQWDILGFATADYIADSIYRIEADGSALTTKKDGSTTGMPSGTNATIESGTGGIWAYGTSGRLDDWEMGNLAGAPDALIPPSGPARDLQGVGWGVGWGIMGFVLPLPIAVYINKLLTKREFFNPLNWFKK